MLLGVLGYLKYAPFLVRNLNFLAEKMLGGELFTVQKLLLPVGISFYTLQAVGYLADVYWGKIKAETHPGKLALFLGFFPQIMEGPISMYSQTADQLWEGKALSSADLWNGGARILWGLFKKLVIADRLYIPVRQIFGHYQDYGGLITAAGAVAYTIQLYMEFSGCMDIVIGSGRMFGIRLPENFRQPFASADAAEFWRRWHITLGTWLKTYVFYPVSMSGPVKRWNQFGRTHCGKYITKLGVSAWRCSCLAVQRSLAWTQVELYFLWYVLFCRPDDRNRPGTGGKIYQEGDSHPGGCMVLAWNKSIEDLGDHLYGRVVFPGRWFPGRTCDVS